MNEYNKTLNGILKITHEKEFFFKNVIIISAEKNSVTNSASIYLTALQKKNTYIKIYSFDACTVKCEENDNSIHLYDKDTDLTIKEESNIDTIVVARNSILNLHNAMAAVDVLEKWGFLILNPIKPSLIAADKYKSAELLTKHNIPQPRYALLEKSDIEEAEKSLIKKLKQIYPNINDLKEDDQKELKYVLKILDGCGGKGVCLVTGDEILSVLQTIFALDENRKMIVQRFEKCKGGDIRIHVLTHKHSQKILGAMKRIKIDGDFRSNVCLGATAEQVKLTKEQEEIALKVGKASGIPWCAVDLMELEHGSNPEVGDNVVIEYNNSPGIGDKYGISSIMGVNFLEVLFENLNKDDLLLSPLIVSNESNIQIKCKSNIHNIGCEYDLSNKLLRPLLSVPDYIIKDDKITFEIHGNKYSYQLSDANTITIDEICIGHRKLKDVICDVVKGPKKMYIDKTVCSKLSLIIEP